VDKSALARQRLDFLFLDYYIRIEFSNYHFLTGAKGRRDNFRRSDITKSYKHITLGYEEILGKKNRAGKMFKKTPLD